MLQNVSDSRTWKTIKNYKNEITRKIHKLEKSVCLFVFKAARSTIFAIL